MMVNDERRNAPAQQDENEQSLQEQEQIVAALCEDAPNETVRNCLRKYSPRKQAWQIEALFKQEKKQVLVETLAFLGQEGMQQYRADALPHELICRVQNLLSDKCNLCNALYCVKLTDRPIVSCVRCGQGCHNACVMQLLGITEDGLIADNNYGADILNPHASVGLFYFCGFCKDKIIPQKESLKIKNKSKTQNAPLGTSSDSAQTTPSETQQENQVSNDPAAEDQSVDNQNNRNPIPKNQEAPRETLPAFQRDSLSRQRISRQNLDQSQETNLDRPVCRFYKQGRCKHGISGKKDGACNLRHPKPCRKFLTNGNRRQRGCTLGSQCQFFHPQMCNSSLRERICYREDCKFMHVKGTKRSPSLVSQPENSIVNPQNLATVGSADRAYAQAAKANRSPDLQNQNVFLDQFKALNDQIQNISSKIQQMDFMHQAMYQHPMFRVNLTQPPPFAVPQATQQQLFHQGTQYQQPQLLQRAPLVAAH